MKRYGRAGTRSAVLAGVVMLLGARACPAEAQDFDPAAAVPARTTELGEFHESRAAAGLAERLVARGGVEEVSRAEQVLDVLLACQERRPERRSVGNFLWMLEDRNVSDPNAVEFVLEHLIPMMVHHGDRLSEPMRQRVLESIRLGLGAIRRIDVTIRYTNIAALDIANTCVGGELIGDADIAVRGRRKLEEWMTYTWSQGACFEYNSPTYSRVTVGALNYLIRDIRDEELRVLARAMRARLALGIALRIHRGTGRWAGPHSRAYQPTVVCERQPEVLGLRRWIAEGSVSPWIANVLDHAPVPMAVTETASRTRKTALTTYHAPSFALGVATREQGKQSDVFMVHYRRPGAPRPGVLYSRYLTNDKWMGDFYHQSDRSYSRNLLDEGLFYGVQSGPRAIGLYTPRSSRSCTSAKAALIWTQRAFVDEIWAGGQRIESLPAPVPEGAVVVVVSGDALMAIRPLAMTHLGDEHPLQLTAVGDNLVLEMYNYRGPERPLRVLRKHPQCGFYAEVAERTHYRDGLAFAEAVARGVITERVIPSFELPASQNRIWHAAYARDGRSIGIEVDLSRWALKRRWTEAGDLGWPMLESPVAGQARDGVVAVGNARLECGPGPAWLFADPAADLCVAGYHGPPRALRLSVRGRRVTLDAMGTGTIVWQDGAVSVDALGVQGTANVYEDAGAGQSPDGSSPPLEVRP